MANETPQQPTWLVAFALGIDLVGLLAIAGLVYSGKVTPAEGLPWMALLLGFTRSGAGRPMTLPPLFFDDQQRCTSVDGARRCERPADHDGDHATGLNRGHGNPWEHDRCFHFAGGDGTRCVLIHRHPGEHVIDAAYADG